MRGKEAKFSPDEEKRLAVLQAKISLSKSGYAGILPSGEMVDRRKYPNAIPIQKNTLFGVPEPLEVGEPFELTPVKIAAIGAQSINSTIETIRKHETKEA